MNILSIILFSFAINLDNITLGLLYGINKVKINRLNQLLIILITTIGTFISLLFGQFISTKLSAKTTSLIGFLILAFIGISAIIKQRKSEKLDLSEVRYLKKLNLKETIFLGMLLSLNNLSIGIGTSIQGLNMYLTLIISFIVGYTLLLYGLKWGDKKISIIVKEKEELITGLTILVLAILKLFGL